MIKANFDWERRLAAEGHAFIVGTDEAGRGPLAGPVVAAAAMLRDLRFIDDNLQAAAVNQGSNVKMLDLVRDSKTLSHKQREEVFEFIQEYFHVGIGICDHQTIDRINILEASFLAMKKAVADLARNKSKAEGVSVGIGGNFIVLVDGNKVIPNFSHAQKAVVGGDKFVKSIAAASIAAKVTRDRIMLDMHDKFPMYAFEKHKGYGTARHLEMLREYGPCEIHRKSFAPVADLVKRAK